MNDRRRTIAGMILAAGFGERMLPLTRTLPKPLLPVLGAPLLEIVARKLLRAGARPILANLHHLPDAIERFAADRGLPVAFHREDEILGTGGGIGGMAPAAAGADCVLLHNGDVVADIDFAAALAYHEARDALVTLVLAPDGPRRNVAVGSDGAVLSIGDAPPGAALLGYTGMAILAAASLAFFPRGKKAGLVDILSGMIGRRPGSVAGWNAGGGGAPYAWGDCGSPASYLDVHRRILLEKTAFDPLIVPPPGPVHEGEGSVVEPGARLSGFCEIGRRAAIGRNAAVENCVLLEGARVANGERRRNEIVFSGGSLQG
jgi:NDP-sugar pyrophosphorylase family protein